MSHSNSSLNCFLACPHKYKMMYIDGIKPDTVSPHLTFGIMAHDVLYKAGIRRDEAEDGVISEGDYSPVIPSEVLYSELKEYFGIPNWEQYFKPVIKQVAEYEKKILSELVRPIVNRELKLQLEPDRLYQISKLHINQPLVGVIDFLAIDEFYENAVILDYKFSSERKTQSDFDMNSQLYIYALLANKEYGVPLRNIEVGYIDIPKKPIDKPIVLKNGTLSRSKSQNIPAEIYKKCVIAVHGNDPYYNCDEGGYYEDIYHNLVNVKPAYLSTQYLDIDAYYSITGDVEQTAFLIDRMVRDGLPFCRKYDSYSCKSCDMLNKCKKWLQVNPEE